MKSTGRRSISLSVRRLAVRTRIAIALLIALSLSGCFERLAQKHEFFVPNSRTAEAVRQDAEFWMAHQRTLQVERRACAKARSDAAAEGFVSSDSTSSGVAELPVKLGRDCPERTAQDAYGARGNAYRRWVEDRVRELPEPDTTASSIASN